MAGEKSTITKDTAVTTTAKAIQADQKPAIIAKPRQAPAKKLELSEVILYPYMTEKAVRLTEKNKIVFIVPRSVGKPEIKRALEENYGVKVEKINTVISPLGKKKAYVLLSKESSAGELASKLGML